MARPLFKKFRNHDSWYRENKEYFYTVHKDRVRDDYPIYSDGSYGYWDVKKRKRSFFRHEINDRVDDILSRGYGIYNAKKRDLFPHVLAVLNGDLTPSQAAYNYAMTKHNHTEF